MKIDPLSNQRNQVWEFRGQKKWRTIVRALIWRQQFLKATVGASFFFSFSCYFFSFFFAFPKKAIDANMQSSTLLAQSPKSQVLMHQVHRPCHHHFCNYSTTTTSYYAILPPSTTTSSPPFIAGQLDSLPQMFTAPFMNIPQQHEWLP